MSPATPRDSPAPPGTGPRLAWGRLPLLVLGFAALAVGTAAGLARLAWPMPPLAAGAAAWHGPLMVCGFFGVVISLERAVAIASAVLPSAAGAAAGVARGAMVGRRWAYAAPVAAALGTVALMHGADAAAPWLYLAASAGLLAASLHVLARQRTAFNLVITLGAAGWSVGTGLWATGTPVPDLVGWWLAFLVLTIAGERLELSRFMPPSAAARRLFGAIVAALLAALVTLAATRAAAAGQAFGLALAALAAWLLANDIARRTVRQRGLTRYIAACLLTGYGWLAAGGLVIGGAGLGAGGPAYDAALHALLLGFVFAMVFGHAPIIFPAVLRVRLPYHAAFYTPLALLHASVALRLAGDALLALGREGGAASGLVRWGALLSALALLAFVATMAQAAWRGRRAAS
ncbi:MAG: hypothetical protein JNJ89_10505 [Rubrivivax sp.]|nr:hypothetical protein [Rubrivivax sp.]